MLVHNTLHRCKAHPGSLEVLRPMQPLKDAEQLVGILH